MKTSSLTDARLRALTAGTHTDGENLLVRVSPHGVRTFFYKFKDVHGKMQALNLGRYDTLTLSGARELKEKCKALIAKGLHPKLALEPESETENFGQVAEMFVSHHEKTLKDGGVCGLVTGYFCREHGHRDTTRLLFHKFAVFP
jgi:hypothetical protein